MRRFLIVVAGVAGIVVMTASQALAHDCFVANKPVGAGSVVTVNVDTGTVTPNKPNPGTQSQPHGGFITLTGTVNGVTVTGDTFAHAPANAQAPFAEPGVNPGALKQTQMGKGCDGKGLDTFGACFGGQ